MHLIKITDTQLKFSQHPFWIGDYRRKNEKDFWVRLSGWESHRWILSIKKSGCQRGQKRAAWMVGARAAETEQTKTLCHTWRQGSNHETTPPLYWVNPQPQGTFFKTCLWMWTQRSEHEPFKCQPIHSKKSKLFRAMIHFFTFPQWVDFSQIVSFSLKVSPECYIAVLASLHPLSKVLKVNSSRSMSHQQNECEVMPKCHFKSSWWSIYLQPDSASGRTIYPSPWDAMFQAKVKQTQLLSQLLKGTLVDSNSSFQADRDDRMT